MKKFAIILLCGLAAMTAQAKDVRIAVLTTNPAMHCAKCEAKIKKNLRFEKGVRRIDTDVKAQRVTVEYDHDKNTAQDIAASFKKFGYGAAVLCDSVPAKKNPVGQ